MLFPSMGTGIMANWIIEWRISTVDLKVLLNDNYFYLGFIFGSFCLRVMLSSSLHLCSVALSSNQQMDDTADTSGQKEFPFSDSWVHLKWNRCSLAWNGFISKAEFLSSSSFFLFFFLMYFYLALRSMLSTNSHHLWLMDLSCHQKRPYLDNLAHPGWNHCFCAWEVSTQGASG